MTTPQRRKVDVFTAETGQRQQIGLGADGRTTQVRLRGARPVHVFELAAGVAFVPGGAIPLPEVGSQRPGFTTLATALLHLGRRRDQVVLVAGHGGPGTRASLVRALLAGDAEAFAGAATGAATVKEWQALLAWVARGHGIDCDPRGADGVVGPRTRAALAGFRAAHGLGGASPDAPGVDDWRALFALLDGELARLTDGSLAAARPLRFVEGGGGAVECGALWPVDRVSIVDHMTMFDERVDVLCFAEADAPQLACHAGGGCDGQRCDVFRKGKYRCEDCRPLTPGAGFRCLDVDGPHFDFDRSLVRADGFPALARVKELLDEDPRREALIYGHTDTVGTDEYNKALSERRARAVLALLTRDVDALEELARVESWGAPVTDLLAATTGLPASSTRRSLLEAYAALAMPEPLPVARFRPQLGGQRFMGCGELNPVGDGLGEPSRRVVIMVFDPDRAPRELPCIVGDLRPCLASCRPARATRGGAPASTFRCAVFRRLANRCACRPAPPLRIERFTGSHEDGPELEELTVPHQGHVELDWKIDGSAAEVVIHEVSGDRRVERHRTQEKAGTVTLQPEGASVRFELTARAAPSKARGFAVTGGAVGAPGKDDGAATAGVDVKTLPPRQPDRFTAPSWRADEKALRADPTGDLLEKPARALTLEQAAHVVAHLAQEGRFQLRGERVRVVNGRSVFERPDSFPHWNEDGTKLLYPCPEPRAAHRWVVTLRPLPPGPGDAPDAHPIIRGSAKGARSLGFRSLLGKVGKDDNAALIDLDVRQVVALCRLTDALLALEASHGIKVVAILHIGFNAQASSHAQKFDRSSPPKPVEPPTFPIHDAHKSGRALDFGGVAISLGGKDDEIITVVTDWGAAELPPVEQPADKKLPRLKQWPATTRSTYYRLEHLRTAKPTDKAGRAAVMFHAAFEAFLRDYTVVESAATTYDTKDYTNKDRLGTGRDQKAEEVQVVLHPDFPDPRLRADHHNHIHANVGTLAYEYPSVAGVDAAKARATELGKDPKAVVGQVPANPPMSPSAPFKHQAVLVNP